MQVVHINVNVVLESYFLEFVHSAVHFLVFDECVVFGVVRYSLRGLAFFRWFFFSVFLQNLPKFHKN